MESDNDFLERYDSSGEFIYFLFTKFMEIHSSGKSKVNHGMYSKLLFNKPEHSQEDFNIVKENEIEDSKTELSLSSATNRLETLQCICENCKILQTAEQKCYQEYKTYWVNNCKT